MPKRTLIKLLKTSDRDKSLKSSQRKRREESRRGAKARGAADVGERAAASATASQAQRKRRPADLGCYAQQKRLSNTKANKYFYKHTKNVSPEDPPCGRRCWTSLGPKDGSARRTPDLHGGTEVPALVTAAGTRARFLSLFR